MTNPEVARVRDALRENKRKGDTAMSFIDVCYYSYLDKLGTEIFFNVITALCGSLIAIEAC